MSLFLPHRRPIALGTGVPLFRWLAGLWSQRVKDDATGSYLIDDATGARVYAEVSNG